MDPVVHFELPAEDRDKMVRFYSTVFGWQAQTFGPEMGNYTVVTTTESDQNGRPVAPGTINGGFYMKTDDPMSHAPSVVIGVEDARASMAAIEKEGGTILRGPDEVPGVGYLVIFQDCEGNRLSVLQPLPFSAENAT